ncbi:hypothetical protein J6590_046045 [Homalodisca vitripennis]|nr:hypothetical protein J6590_046045 [Homalodisca vitripennis]
MRAQVIKKLLRKNEGFNKEVLFESKGYRSPKRSSLDIQGSVMSVVRDKEAVSTLCFVHPEKADGEVR